MNYEIVYLEEKLVVGKSIITTNENGKAIEDIGDMWQSFINDGIFEKIENKASMSAIGLYTDYQGDFSKPYSFMCCIEVEKIGDSDLENRKISGGKYAKFVINGDVKYEVGKAWGEIWNMNLPRLYTDDFELYLGNNDKMDNQTVEIYIAVE